MRWTTIGLSAGAEHALTNQPEPKTVDWGKRIVSIFIPAILGIGLLTAFAYVGVRIVAGKSQSTTPPAITPQPPVIAQPAPAPAPPKIIPKPTLSPITPANFTIITPQPGERYLQVAAVSPHMVLTYVDRLREVNLDAVVAPGPTPDLLRILVGPFADRDPLDKAKAQLEASGRSPIIRSY